LPSEANEPAAHTATTTATHAQADKEAYIQADTQANAKTHIQTHEQTNIQADKEAHIQADKEAHIQADRQTHRVSDGITHNTACRPGVSMQQEHLQMRRSPPWYSRGRWDERVSSDVPAANEHADGTVDTRADEHADGTVDTRADEQHTDRPANTAAILSAAIQAAECAAHRAA